jgi:hypothetical protein
MIEGRKLQEYVKSEIDFSLSTIEMAFSSLSLSLSLTYSR